jgi:hypothetical protein
LSRGASRGASCQRNERFAAVYASRSPEPPVLKAKWEDDAGEASREGARSSAGDLAVSKLMPLEHASLLLFDADADD